MLLWIGTAEVPKDNEVVQVVPGVPYGDILEQTAFCSQKVIHTGPHLPLLTVHDTCLPIPCPLFVTHEEVRGHFLQYGGCNGRPDLFSVAAPLQRRYVGVKFTAPHNCCPAGVLYNG